MGRISHRGEFALKTVTMLALPEASRVDEMLESLVMWLGIVPSIAGAVTSRDRLPVALQEIVWAAGRAGRSWCAWADGKAHVWLFVGEQSWPLSGARGAPVLELKYYREHGFREAGTWMLEAGSKWQRCIDLPN
jgi:hypothetical protein